MGRTTRVGGGHAPRLDFPVTADMIETAIPQDSAHCMIADGLKAAMPQARNVTVDLATIRFTDVAKGRRYIYLTPPTAQFALLKFDNGEKPDPFAVKAIAAQIVEPERIRKKRRVEVEQATDVRPTQGSEPTDVFLGETPETTDEPTDVPLGETPPGATDTLGRPLTHKRQMPMVVASSGKGERAAPVKVGGKAPPLGALAVPPTFRTGRRRGFGLRVMGR